MNERKYFDYAATTPLDERVFKAMQPYWTEIFGNPSSVHYFGQQADHALEEARRSVARLLNARPDEIVFTSGGSESDNLALRGTALARREQTGANHLLISPVEHHAVSHTARQLADQSGFELEFVPVDEFGRVSARDVAERLRPTTAVVSVVYANNEIGTINPIAEIGAVCREMGVPLHTDAVQGAAHLPMDVERDKVDLLSMGAHKFYGPKGVGVLYIRRGTPVLPVQTGGSQEHNLRAGTQNLPLIAGLAEAFRIAQEESEENARKYRPMRDRLIGRVLEEIPDARLTGHAVERLPNHASFVFKGVDGNALLMLLDGKGYACSSGSACRVGNPKPSEILLATGLSEEWALGSLRITLGRDTTPEDVDALADDLPDLVAAARSFSSQ